MTYKEAIDVLNNTKVMILKGSGTDLQKASQMAIEAINKQIPKKLNDYKEHGLSKFKTGKCPSCGEHLCQTFEHCFNCGQAILWESE